MPLQNRVTPFGEIVAVTDRGTLTGNRGIIHDPATRHLLSKRWASKAWITCRCDYKDVRRVVMAGRSWTELFFLDEATALAAGHRPCFLCRRTEAEAFRAAWARGHRDLPPTAPRMDAILHGQRLQDRAKRIHGVTCPVTDMPDGTMVTAEGDAFVIAAGRPLLWSAGGYRIVGPLKGVDGLITPPATVLALRAGYLPMLHPSAGMQAGLVGRPSAK